jgi:hypothetical protein
MLAAASSAVLLTAAVHAQTNFAPSPLATTVNKGNVEYNFWGPNLTVNGAAIANNFGTLFPVAFGDGSYPAGSNVYGAPATTFSNVINGPVNTGQNNFVDQFIGEFIPPVSGNYVFFVCSDDYSQLYLGTDISENSARLIAQETAWSNPGEWTVSSGGSSLASKRSDQFIPPGQTLPQYPGGIALTAGNMYFFDFVHEQGGGGLNDSVTYKLVGQPDPVTGASSIIVSSNLAFVVQPPSYVAFSRQPTNITVTAGLAANFGVSIASDATPYIPIYQWQKNGVNITNADGTAANGPLYSAIVMTNDSGASFRCVISFAGVTNTYTSSAGVLTVTPGTIQTGGLKREYFTGAVLGGTNTQSPANVGSISGLIAGDVGPATYTALLPSFDASKNDGINNYAQRISGFFIPPVTTNYVFFINSDDQSDLFLSTNSSPSNKVLIAEETVWSNPDQWTVSGGGSSLSQKRSDQFIPAGGSVAPFANGIPLVAGQMYYIEGDHNQGGGGDNFGVTYKYIGAPDPITNSASLLTNGNIAYETIAGPYTISITSQPTSAQVYSGSNAVFTFGVTSSSEFTPAFQWTQNGTNLASGTGSTLTVAASTLNNGFTYQATATVPGTTNSVTSGIVSLTTVALPATNTYAAAVLSNSPIAYYRFSETSGTTAYDFAGGHNGTYQANAVLGDPGVPNPPFKGFESGNLSFASTKSTTNSWVLAPFGGLGANTSVTLSCWIYPVGAQNGNLGLIFDRAGQAGGLDINGSGMLGYTWNNNSSATWGFNSGLIVPSNQWSFCVLTISPSAATLYLYNTNLIGQATNAIAHVPLNNNNQWRIGDDSSSDPGRAFNGMIDEVAIFPSALTLAQVQTLYAAAGVSLPPSFPNPPISHILYPGETATFSSAAAGSPPFTYQWSKNGTPLTDGGRISGSSTTNLTISSITSADAGTYTISGTNSVGSSTSSGATLTVLATPAAGSYPAAVLAANPIAYYRLNETNGTVAYDFAGGHDGTYLLGTPGGPGVPNTAFPGFVDTNNLAVSITNVPGGRQVLTPFGTLAGPNGQALPNLTFTCWLYPIGNQNASLGLIFDRGTGSGLDMGQGASLGELGYTWNNNNGNTYGFVSGLTPPQNQWSLAALSITPTQAVLYLYNANGQQSATNAIAHSQPSSAIVNNWDLGNDGGTTSRTFNGMMDEVAVFTNALSEEQILTLYAAAADNGAAGFPPTVAQQPESHTLYAGGTAVFYGGVVGQPPLTFKWQKNNANLTDGGNISGSATSTLIVGNTTAADAGTYTLTVQNGSGNITTAPATLTVLAPPVSSNYAGAVISAGAIAYYPLSETNGTEAFDLIGGNDGTYQTGVTLGQLPGENPPFTGFPANDAAALLSGSTPLSWVLTPFGNLGNYSNVTLTAWIYPEGGAQNSFTGILFDRTGGVGGLNYFNTGTLGYTWNGAGSTYNFNSGLNIPSNQWSFVGLSISPTQAVLYLYNTNGQTQATNAIAHSPMTTANEWHVGNDFNSDPGRTFNGLMDSVAVFTNALTPAQMISLYGAAVVQGVLPPNISVQPVPSQIAAGRTAHFSVTANGGGPLSYQWSLNGNKLTGATNASLLIPNAQAANAGTYTVTVSINVGSQSGSITSSNAPLTVVSLGTEAYVVAVSNLNPVAYWRFSEPAGSPYAFDIFGGNTATYGSGTLNGVANAQGPATPSYPGFASGNPAFYTVNSTPNSYVSVPPLNLNTNNMTLVAWIYPSGAQSAGAGVVVSDALSTYAGIEYTGQDALGFIWNGVTYPLNLNVTESAWSLVALSVQSNQATLYVYNPYNSFLGAGVQNVGVDLGNFPPMAFNGPTEFGNDPSGAAGIDTFNGFIDEVSIFNYALNSGQVAALYTAGSGQAVAPEIALLSGPEGALQGQPLHFTVQATGSSLSYQWQFNGNNIAGATTSALTIANPSAANIGSYTVLVGNSAGQITSNPTIFGELEPASAYASLIESMSPIGYYRLDETSGTTAFDWSGYGNTGAYQSAALVDQPGPSDPPFLGFPGNNSAAGMVNTAAGSWVLAPFGNLGIPNVSFSCWIYPMGSQQAWAGVITSRANGVSGALASGQQQGGVNYNANQMIGYTWNQNNANTYNWASGLVPPQNQWSLVVVTIQPTAGTVYLYNSSGQLAATNAIAHTSDAFGNGWRLGDDQDGDPGRTFNGYMAEVAVFPYTLTQTQVNTMWNTALNGGGTVGPTVTIQRSGANLVVSWSPTGGRLYSTPVLGPNKNWQVISTNNPATIPITGAEQFFEVGP